jgi:hypothetical protein
VGQDEGRSVVALYDLTDRVALATARHSKQDLVAQPAAQSVNQLVYRLGLIAGRLKGGLESKV